jgi:DNA invertase Pin-like site-specific DNA recombinase
MKKPVRVAIYARVSTADQNPEAQLLALREYAAQRGFTIYKEYVDHVTGNLEKRSARRKPGDTAYQQLLEDVGQRLVDCVLVWKYDRFARSLGVLITALEQFSSLGVDFISYTQNIDTTTPMGRLFYHIIGSFAEFEREIIGERVRAGLSLARAQGTVLGRPLKDRTAPARITALRNQGLSLREIARREKRSASSVLQILRQQNSAVDHAKG